MSYSSWRYIALVLAIILTAGCSYYQPTKNVWKTTKGLWNEYVSPPASVDYDDTGGLAPEAVALSKSMMGVDGQLLKLERAMQNADKPPTQEWLNNFLAQFPWMSGFAGVKYDGSILGQQPAESMKELDFNSLLYEDAKQNSRALRVDVQPSPLGPEVMVATPLYDGVDFLGVVVAYFDMRNLMRYSQNRDDIVVLCPTALLWPGRYDFAATPLAGVDWAKVVRESAYGTCSNRTGSFVYMVRYLGNLPLVFATPGKGEFPARDGNLEQGYAYFPKEREKMAPPPLPERKPKEGSSPAFVKEEEPVEAVAEESAPQEAQAAQPAPQRARGRGAGANDLEPGSRESILLRKGGSSRGGRVQERQLEGENVEVERVQRPRRPARRPDADETPIELAPDSSLPTLPGGRPSPFGPREEEAPAREYKRPSPFGPSEEAAGKEQPAVAEPATGAASGQSSGTDNRLADGEKAPATGSAEEEAKASATGGTTEPASAQPEKQPESGQPQTGADKTAPDKPATLPGGRPSPFGPR